MKNITLSANGTLIEAAREKARRRQTTLNAEFRQWLQDYVENQQDATKKAEKAMAAIDALTSPSKIDRKYTREEMNARR